MASTVHRAYFLSTKMLSNVKSIRPCRAGRKALLIRQDFRLSAMTQTAKPTVSVAEPQGGAERVQSQTPTIIAGVLAVAVASAIAYKKWAAKQEGDPFASAIKRVNTTPVPELSDEQQAAARARRQKERANHKLLLEDIELPENHPWATKEPTTKEDEKLWKARLRVTRGLPPQSLSDLAQDDKGNMRQRPRRVSNRAMSPESQQ